MKRDKWLHLAACAVVAAVISLVALLTGGSVVSSAVAGFLGAVACGAGKEYGDSRSAGNRWDNGDFVADIVGASVVLIIAAVAYIM